MSEPTVPPEEVEHVARLSRIRLEDTEVERYAEQFESILSAFETLDEVESTDEEETLVNVMRKDEVRPSLDRDAALRNAPEHEDGYFRGPPVS